MGREKYGTSPMGIFPYMRYACRRVRRRDIYHPIIKTQVMTIRTFSITRRVLFIEKGFKTKGKRDEMKIIVCFGYEKFNVF